MMATLGDICGIEIATVHAICDAAAALPWLGSRE